MVMTTVGRRCIIKERQFFMVKLLKITCFDLALIKMSRALPKKLLLLDFSREGGGAG